MTNWWIHADGYIYTGDPTPGSREATEDEIQQHLNPVKTTEDRIEDIERKYQIKFDGLAQRLNVVTLSDGTTQESKTIETQNEYLQLSDQKDLEILSLFEGGE